MRKYVSPVLPVFFFVVALAFALPANAGDLDSSLIEAAKKGDIASMQTLLAEGADVNASYRGFTALMNAAGGGQTAAVRLLLDAGADVNATTKDGATALMAAAEQGFSPAA